MAETEQQMPGTSNVASEAERGDDFNGPARDELLAAVREAGGTGAVDVDAEAAAAEAGTTTEAARPAATKVATEATAETTDPDEPKIAVAIRAREQAQRQRDEAQDYAAQMKQRAEQEAQATIQAARKKAQDDYEAELTQLRAKFRESPTAATRALGIPPEQIVDEVTREGTPEWQAMRRMQAELDQAKAGASKAEEVAKELAKFREEQQRERAEAMREQVRTEFMSTHASPDKTPYLHKRWEPEEIFERCNQLAIQWQKAGVQFAHSDVAEYLEYQSRKRILGDVDASAPQQARGAAGQPAGNAPKVKANGTRTLSAANGSERRSSPKPIREMSAEEEREALIAEAREARKGLGNPDV